MNEHQAKPKPKRDKIRSMIYGHWKQFHPEMLKQFQQENRLEEEIETTAEQMEKLMYRLVVVDKMEYWQAWELVIDQFLLPETEEPSSTSQ